MLPGFAIFSGVAWISLVLPFVLCSCPTAVRRLPVQGCSTGASVSGVSKCVAGLMGEVRQCLIILSM